ncbi:MAG: hypothetical protein CBHOC_0648 [uncultured Caballeronia sp.]|nr:MAG: hypothetical protein CBHOC_0648 [uncultured Caballeronia sp.]
MQQKEIEGDEFEKRTALSSSGAQRHRDIRALVTAGFVETAPAYEKTTEQPQVLNASAVAVADKYAAIPPSRSSGRAAMRSMRPSRSLSRSPSHIRRRATSAAAAS